MYRSCLQVPVLFVSEDRGQCVRIELGGRGVTPAIKPRSLSATGMTALAHILQTQVRLVC